MLPAGVAAGHPATSDAGLEILEDGGSAADAAVAACLASCVAETVMTGLLGGGHAIHVDGATGRTRNLDFFVTVPSGEGGPMRDLQVPFGAELVHYAIGPASCAVPGVPAGLGALWEAHGRLPWPRLVEPALRLARDGVELPPAHAACLAMVAPVYTLDEGARIFAPGGRLLAAGERLEQPGLARALELLAAEGAASAYAGTIAEALVALCRARGGAVTAGDLAGYEARWAAPAEVGFRGRRVLTRTGLSGVPETLGALPPLDGASETERVLALVAVLAGGVERSGDTTNLVTADRDGNVCVLTTSLGLGSGDYLPGLDLQLNSMLGEAELLLGPLEPGARMGSMMAPTVALDTDGPALAIGAAGGSRLRTALVGCADGILREGLEPQAAVDRPRFHPVERVLHAEPGVDGDALAALGRQGWEVREWPDRHHYFGGVSLIARGGAAGDPRRSGSARACP
ncbi:MAG: gamma-glutamyltransferase [Pseudomonadota bacterium]